MDEETDLLNFCAHEIAPNGVEHLKCGPLRFRSRDQIRLILTEADLMVDDVFGGYRNEPVGYGVGSLIIVAYRL